MSKLIRFDENHYGYLVEFDLTRVEAETIGEMFQQAYPGKRLLVIRADEFIDLVGQSEVVQVAEPVA